MATTISGSSGINTQGVTSSGTVSGATVTSSGTVSGATVTSSGTVSGTTVTSSGDVNDTVGDVREPRFTLLDGGDVTIADEGVYNVSSGATLTTITLGAPSVGTIIAIYNNKSSSITLDRGSTIVGMRKGADNNNTANATLTLGARSLTTITVFFATACVVTGTDVS